MVVNFQVQIPCVTAMEIGILKEVRGAGECSGGVAPAADKFHFKIIFFSTFPAFNKSCFIISQYSSHVISHLFSFDAIPRYFFRRYFDFFGFLAANPTERDDHEHMERSKSGTIRS